MAIFVDENTKVVVQGLTGTQGQFYGLRNRAYGTNVVAGTNPRKAGTDVEGIPIFATVKDAVEATGANTSFVIVPARFAADSIIEAAEGGVSLIICVTEHIPAHDQARVYNLLKDEYPDVRLVGPNCAGILSPGKANIGFTPTEVAMPGGPVGVVSRSGTLAYQALYELTASGIGQTTCVGVGGDPVPGTSFIDVLAAFEKDPATEVIVLIGEIGGSAEEEAADYICDNVTKPVVAYIAGVTAPPGKRMGHAGAIVSGGKGTAQAKIEALEDVGALVARNPTEIGGLVKKALEKVQS
ncbi:MAG: succinate--CoA ligase subunit alpha [Chloroflexota bacterium]